MHTRPQRALLRLAQPYGIRPHRPLVLCAPRLLDPSLDLTLGQLVQLLAVFQRVFDSLNLPAHNWSAINDFAATVVRLVEFERSVGEAKASELV